MNVFNARKAAQVCAFFTLNAGGRINVLRLVKLVYLADRRFMEQYDCTMLHDRLVSMPHGPVNSMTLNYINGLLDGGEDWNDFLSDRENHMVGLSKAELKIDDLDELSQAEVDTLRATWEEFKGLAPFQIRDYTHQHCPEWEDPCGSSTPIPYARVFKFLGKVEHAEALEERVLAERSVADSLC